MENFSKSYLNGLQKVLDAFPHEHFEAMIQAILSAYKDERRIFVMGNGGSATTASHWASDLNKGCCLHLDKKFKVICLNDNIPTMLAYANDLSYEDVFVEQMKNFYVPGDVIIGISGSGNSANVLRAIEHGKENNGVTVGLCGYDGGQLCSMVQIPLLAMVNDMQKVEDIHMIIVHMSMQRIFGELNPGEAVC